MNELYIVAIVVIACSAWLYFGLKGKIENLGNIVPQAPQPAPQPAPVMQTQTVSAYPGAPQVSITGPMGAGDEIAAVAMAAIAAYESDLAQAGAVGAVLAAECGVAVSPSPVVTVNRYRRRNSIWVATARYESQKRL